MRFDSRIFSTTGGMRRKRNPRAHKWGEDAVRLRRPRLSRISPSVDFGFNVRLGRFWLQSAARPALLDGAVEARCRAEGGWRPGPRPDDQAKRCPRASHDGCKRPKLRRVLGDRRTAHCARVRIEPVRQPNRPAMPWPTYPAPAALRTPATPSRLILTFSPRTASATALSGFP